MEIEDTTTDCTSSSDTDDDNDEKYTSPFIFEAIDNADTVITVVYTKANYLSRVTQPCWLNTEYIMDVAESHPLNRTAGPGECGIVDRCVLHYKDSPGIHMIRREGYIFENDFPLGTSRRYLDRLLSRLRETPFMSGLRLADRVLTQILMQGEANFGVDRESLARDVDIQMDPESEATTMDFRYKDATHSFFALRVIPRDEQTATQSSALSIGIDMLQVKNIMTIHALLQRLVCTLNKHKR